MAAHLLGLASCQVFSPRRIALAVGGTGLNCREGAELRGDEQRDRDRDRHELPRPPSCT